jgi:hypothetical protein
MFPVPRYAEQMIREWSAELAAHFGTTAETFKEQPIHSMSFPSEVVRVELMDGSMVEFRYAFAIVSESQRAIAVFTEHCGHHVFPYHEAKVFSDGKLIFEQRHG